MSKASKRSLSSSTVTSDSSDNNKRPKTSESFKFPGTNFYLFKAPLHSIGAGLYERGEDQSSECNELNLTDYDCTLLMDIPGVAKKGDVADSIHHDFELGIMEVTINDKIYRIKMGYFMLGDIQVTDLKAKEWDGSLVNIQ